MMRFQKYILLLAITLISAITIQAQNIGGGIIVGFNASQVSGDNAAGYDKIGLNTGVIGMVPFNDKWSANIEINYAQLFEIPYFRWHRHQLVVDETQLRQLFEISYFLRHRRQLVVLKIQNLQLLQIPYFFGHQRQLVLVEMQKPQLFEISYFPG